MTQPRPRGALQIGRAAALPHIAWGDERVDVVIESAGRFTDWGRDNALWHRHLRTMPAPTAAVACA